MQQIDDLTNQQCWYTIGKECTEARKSGETRHEANQLVGLKYGCSADAVGHRERYSRAVDRIRIITPDYANALLTGEIALSVTNTVRLAKKQPKAIKLALERLTQPGVTFVDVFPEYSDRNKKTKISIKDAPLYDPDAQVTGLIYTIPSWMDCLERMALSANFSAISAEIYNQLQKALGELKNLTEDVIKIIT